MVQSADERGAPKEEGQEEEDGVHEFPIREEVFRFDQEQVGEADREGEEEWKSVPDDNERNCEVGQERNAGMCE